LKLSPFYNISRLLINLLLRAFLNLSVQLLKETNKWKKSRLTSWSNNVGYSERRIIKILKLCCWGFKLLYLICKFWIRVILHLILSRWFPGIFLPNGDLRLLLFKKQKIWTNLVGEPDKLYEKSWDWAFGLWSI